jgi:hypothetical protein
MGQARACFRRWRGKSSGTCSFHGFYIAASQTLSRNGHAIAIVLPRTAKFASSLALEIDDLAFLAFRERING